MGLVDGQARAKAFERWRGVLASKAAAESARRRKDVEERFLAEPFEGSVSLEDVASPEFQAELAGTLEAAALTPSKKAHELLAKLLARRLRKGPDLAEATKLQVARRVISMATDEALLGLTLASTLCGTCPLNGCVTQGLDDHETMFKTLLGDAPLPQGTDWLDQLDALGALHLAPGMIIRKTDKICLNNMAGYVATGLAEGSPALEKAKERLAGAGLPLSILTPHELAEGYTRLAVSTPEVFKDDGAFIADVDDDGRETRSDLTMAQRQAILDVYGMYEKDTAKEKKNLGRLMAMWNERPTLRALKSWWDGLDKAFEPTSAGTLVADVNTSMVLAAARGKSGAVAQGPEAC